jgi:hypothetical protein
MNKIIKNLLLILVPFYPFWAFLSYTLFGRPVIQLAFIILIPVAAYLLVDKSIRIPKYLAFFMLFTVYHISSIVINDLLPKSMGLISFIVSDINLFACLILLIVENTEFDKKFIRNTNYSILLVVFISFIISIIQTGKPVFFVSPQVINNYDGYRYLLENRAFSIFSWVDLNTIGISFPIMLSLLLCSYEANKRYFPLIIIFGIVVSFLTRARYVMISTIIIFSQLFFVSKIKAKVKIYVILIFVASSVLLISLAKNYGINLNQILNERILESSTNLASAKARVLSFHVFLKVFPENPFLGVGPVTRGDVIHLLGGAAPLIHVGYLSYLYYYGLFGSVFLFMTLFFLLKYAWDVGRKFRFWGSFYGLLSFCFANFTMVYFNFSEMGIVLAVIYLKYYSSDFSDEVASQ